MLRVGMCIIILAVAIVGCGNNTPVETPTPDSHVASHAIDYTVVGMQDVPQVCDELVTVSLRSVEINKRTAEMIGILSNTHEVEVVVLLTDGYSISEFNYHVEPVTIGPSAVVTLDRFHAAIELSSNEPVYVWIMIKDTDHGGLGSSVINASADTIIAYLIGKGLSIVGAGTGVLIAADLVWNLLANALTEKVAQDDLIGDLAFMLDARYGWGHGRHEVTTPRNTATIKFDIRHYTSCDALFSTSSPGTMIQTSDSGSSASACSALAPPSRLQPGDLAIVSVPPDRTLRFREGPGLQYDSVRYAPGHVMRILGPNQCDGDMMFWKVMSPFGVEGWMAESEYDAYLGQAFYHMRPMGVQF
ncbi:MAG: hypothetical protein JXQ72_14490 [Anaerolineae bacterium]|nr:hypothetical protein [Anaerolineae bacterium]